MNPTMIGLDIAKAIFHVHGVDESNQTVLRKKSYRGDLLALFSSPPCLVGIGAWSGAHHWARKLVETDHDVRLIPVQYVKPYAKRNKTDAADAKAICEAVGRPNMRFVPIKTCDQQAVLALHRVRSLPVRQRTAAVNATRGLMAEFGIVASKGIRRMEELRRKLEQSSPEELPRDPRKPSGPAIEMTRTTRPGTRLQAPGSSQSLDQPCKAGAIHTRRSARRARHRSGA